MIHSFILWIVLATISCSKNTEVPAPLIVQEEAPEDPTDIKVGEVLPAWKNGEMDIHFINTTTGECAFIIMPEGTQMMIDCASSSVKTNSNANTTNTGIRSRWDPTLTNTRGSQIITDYVKKCMKWTGNEVIDYLVLTHFDNDHIGGYTDNLPVSPNSTTYRSIGGAEILDNFKVGKLIDRAYPEYNYPIDLVNKASNAPSIKNYVNAVKWHVANKNLNAEIFKPGKATQIVPKTAVSDFTVQNVAVNGEIWTGSGESTTKTFPALSEITVANPSDIKVTDNCPFENICCCVMKISYGDFDYFAGGDLQYTGKSSYSWKDAETPCAMAAGNVDVMKADHHGVINTQGTSALVALNPRIWIVNSWVDCHPRTSILASVETTLPVADVFITNFWKGERPSGVDDKVTEEEAARVKGYDGNIVVRVIEGGARYYVVTTTDSDGLMTVKSVSGPYESR